MLNQFNKTSNGSIFENTEKKTIKLETFLTLVTVLYKKNDTFTYAPNSISVVKLICIDYL